MPTEYTDTAIWLIIFLAGLGTLALRLSFILLFGRVEEVPPTVAGVLRFVPAAVLAALVAPALVALTVGTDGSPTVAYEGSKLVAGGVAGAVAWRTESVLATIVVGMVTLWTVQVVV